MWARLAEIDREVSQYIHQSELGILDYVVVIFALMCSVVGIPVITLVIFWLLGQHAAFVYAGTVIGGLVITTILKRAFKRNRPTKHAERYIQLRWMENNFSFPSGDSYQAGALAAFLITADADNFYFAGLTILVAFARVYFGFHWVGDTIAGASLGVLITQFTFLRFL